eukprot:TRINITY_DN8798_c0_g1_i1.p1 TRINITY_DN8798_c0_g1~~TRINITY_DN8798_c0_g1_i1.p1  ORF type:complete len:269 (+),score=43.41 TRINITY_DN8798_c0_g1_i1:99-905(+)
MSKKIALVTGAARGLGLAVCKKLLSIPNVVVIPAVRNLSAGQEARESIIHELKLNPESLARPVQIDVTNLHSIDEAANQILSMYSGVDILINNAGLFDKSNKEIERMLQTNYFGVLHMCQTFLPMMRSGGRVVNVAARLGALKQFGTGVQKILTAPDTDVDDLNQLIAEYRVDQMTNAAKQPDRFHGPAYHVSKGAVIALTSILARKTQTPDLLINSVDPGWCRTDMGGPKAPLSPEQGAENIVRLALLEAGAPTGQFWYDGKPHPIL